MASRPRTQGFTLIELLVVIAIIGVLSSAALVSLNSARAKGNDAARISNVKALETAMELYYNDNNSYPQYGSADSTYDISNLESFLVPKDVSTMPKMLVDDKDQYAWANDSYGFYIYTQGHGWCKTGINMNESWWGSGVPLCNF